jgi:hypothetical protein
MFGLFEKPKAIKKAIDGNKTYLVVLIAILAAALDGVGLIEIPAVVYESLPFVGLAALRDGMKKAEKAAKEAVEKLDKK